MIEQMRVLHLIGGAIAGLLAMSLFLELHAEGLPVPQIFPGEAELLRSGQLKSTRQSIRYKGHERPGTIIIETSRRTLLLVGRRGTALQYRIGVGRDGFDWKGKKRISRKVKWPAWSPPREMMERQPYLPARMPGGPNNPLGARALYLGSTLYRIHGTVETWTVGDAVSSGCFRMLNDDVIDLYERVDVGNRVVVR